MTFPLSNHQLNSAILGNGEYYAFTKKEGEKIYLGYMYTTWCGSPCSMHLKFFPVELQKPLYLAIFGESKYDQGMLKTFDLDKRNLLLIDDVYNRAMSWLNKMRHESKHLHLDESPGCLPAVIQVNQGVLYALYEKDEFYKKCSSKVNDL